MVAIVSDSCGCDWKSKGAVGSVKIKLKNLSTRCLSFDCTFYSSKKPCVQRAWK